MPTSSERTRTRRRQWIGAGLVAMLLIGLDLRREPQAQISARLLLAGIDVYQASLSNLMPIIGVRCRFKPTCSHYARGCIAKDGAAAGSLRAAGRLLRCGPWTAPDTIDPP